MTIAPPPHRFLDLQPTPQTDAQEEDAALALEREFTDILRCERGMPEAESSDIVQALLRGLRVRRGGSDLWIPAPCKAERNAAIRRDFRGHNLDEVMRRYGVSRTTVYRVVGGPTAPRAESPTFPL